jgi:hypothetical protein
MMSIARVLGFFGLVVMLSSGFARAEESNQDGQAPPLQRKSVPPFSVLGTLGLLPSPVPTLSYGGWITPQKVPSDILQQRVIAQVPLYYDDGDNLSLSLGGSNLHFGEAQTIPMSGVEIPVDLWRVDVGANYSRKLDDDKILGGRVSVGSASDHPFSKFDVVTVGASAFYSWATSERSRWMVTLFFSNNNPIANYIPIPGFAYIYRTDTFTGIFGLPFSSIVWRPVTPWMFTFAFFGPTINSEAAYGDPKTAQAFLGFSWQQQSYLREDRPDVRDRLYYDEKHAPVGVRFPLLKGVLTELSLGYSFDRFAYEGTHFHDRSSGAASLGSSWYAAWNFKAAL